MDPTKNMLSVLNSLEEIFKDAVGQAFPDLPDAPCPITLSAKFGDYQFNGAMAIAGLLKGFLHSGILKVLEYVILIFINFSTRSQNATKGCGK